MLFSATIMAAVPVISSNPKNDTVCSGSSALFVVAANHAVYPIIGVTYQWQVSSNGGSSWLPISDVGMYSGATTDSLTISGLNLSLNGYMYRTMVYNVYATDTTIDSITSTTSLAAMLVVDSTGNGAISGPSAVCVGSQITLSESFPGGVWSVKNDSASISLSGIVTGLLAKPDTGVGHDTVVYTISAYKCATYTNKFVVTINAAPNAGVITGPSDSLCAGAVITLTDITTGGTWSASNPAAGSISGSGVLTSIAQGFDTIMYTTTTGICSASATYIVRVDTTVTSQPITGPDAVCAGGTTNLMDANIYGTGVWSSGNTAIASVNGEGMVTGASEGSVVISYAFMNACSAGSPVYSSILIQVDTVLNAGTISGATNVCAGSWVSLSDGVIGGDWMSSDPGVAVTDMSGNVTGVAQGVAVISYFLSNACGISSAMATINVDAAASAITGNDSVGIGGIRDLYDATMGGVWSSSNAAIISVNSSTGVAEGVGTGSATITYTVNNACGTTYSTMILYTGIPEAGNITGPDTVCTSSTISLTDDITGGVGVWSSGNTSIATVDNSGHVTGVAFGQTTIYYTYTNGYGSATAHFHIFVNAAPIDSILVSALFSINGSYTFQGYTLNASGVWVATAGTWTSSNPAVAQFYSTVGAVLTITGYGSTTIKYSASNTCGTTDTSFLITIVNQSSVANQVASASSELNVYPNPSQGNFTINLLSTANEQAIVTITNLVGEKVKEFTISTNKAYDLHLDQPDGIYFLNATTASTGKYSAKISIAK